jgi:hypothetical protein
LLALLVLLLVRRDEEGEREVEGCGLVVWDCECDCERDMLRER